MPNDAVARVLLPTAGTWKLALAPDKLLAGGAAQTMASRGARQLSGQPATRWRGSELECLRRLEVLQTSCERHGGVGA